MKYEHLLASRYIKAQKRQSTFTAVSIIAAVAVMTMMFVLYSVTMNCWKNAAYTAAPYHLMIGGLTDEQGEALQNVEHIRSVKLESSPMGDVSAMILFDSDIGDRVEWLQKATEKIGAENVYQDQNYQWNEQLLRLESIGVDAKLFKLRIFCIFFIFAMLFAVALRLIVDTAFEVSSKERERHYGVLQSVGATPEQIVKIITFEGLRLCVIAIPFGLVLGVAVAYIMYNMLLSSGLSDLFQGMADAKLHFSFSVDPKMLLAAAGFGVVWVFFSAYGVGMRIIRKTPMEAITTRADEVKKIKKHTLSGLLFGVSGSIASRNARRQKKRFVITVLTLTVSITLFSLFTSVADTVENSIISLLGFGLDSNDFVVEPVDDPYSGTVSEDGMRDIQNSGMFRDISISTMQPYSIPDLNHNFYVEYVNKEAYRLMFGDDPPVSYEELVRTGGYVLDSGFSDNGYDISTLTEKIKDGELEIVTRQLLSRAQDVKPKFSNEEQKHSVKILGEVKKTNFSIISDITSMYAAIESYDLIEDEWYGGNTFWPPTVSFSYIKENDYNAEDYKKIKNWFSEHWQTVQVVEEAYGDKWRTQSIISAVRAGVLLINVLITLTALINLLNIVSTGIANRRSELASLQCVGMTDRQLDRMALIECLQFTGAAAAISALICAVIIFGTEKVLEMVIVNTFVTESEEMRKALINMVKPDHLKPFIRIAAASLAAFAAGSITSLVMLRVQNKDSLTDRIRGSEMKLSFKKSHILRNSIIAVLGAAVLVIAGLRIYSVVSYKNDRKEYEKAGYLNLVDADGLKMNVYSTGAKNGKHTIVGLAGLGCDAFPVQAAKMNELLGKENTLVYPDRAGYGFSDDSLKKQTVEQVVEDYRAGLKNAGFEAPYVLMGHSYGDLYALYWEKQYPDEVEAIVILDGMIPPKNELWERYTAEEFPSEADMRSTVRRLVLRTWLGLDRLFPEKEADDKVPEGVAVFTEEQLKLSALCGNRSYSAAVVSEAVLDKQEITRMGEILSPTDTPKLYFSTIYRSEDDVREFYERQKADFEAGGKEYRIDPETAARAEWEHMQLSSEKEKKTELDFLDKIGSCRIEYVSGDHDIFFAQKAEQVADSILGFLAETTE